MVGIYKITNPKGKVYIGQSSDISKRFKQYRKGGGKKQVRLYRSFQKYGIGLHVFEVVEECEESLLNNRERYWQEFYNVIGKRGLNCKLVQTEDKPARLSEHTKQLIGQNSGKARKGKSLSKSHKESIRNSLNTSEVFKQALKSEERSGKISKALQGRSLTQEHKDSLKEAQNRRFQTERSPMLGKSHRQESIEKMRKPKTKEHVEKNREARTKYRNIECYTKDGEYVKSYGRIIDAVKDGYLHGAIINCLTGKRGSHKKYLWKFKEE